PRARPKLYFQIGKPCWKVEQHEIGLLVAIRIVVVALVELVVGDKIPVVASTAPRGTSRAFELFRIKGSIAVYILEIGVPRVKCLSAGHLPPTHFSKRSSSTAGIML